MIWIGLLLLAVLGALIWIALELTIIKLHLIEYLPRLYRQGEQRQSDQS